MRAIVLDAAGEIAGRVRLCVPNGVPIVSVAAESLMRALESGGPGDLLVANVPRGPEGLDFARRLSIARFPGGTLALVDHLDDGPATVLRGLPRTECVPRSASDRDLDAALRRFTENHVGLREHPPRGASPPSFYGIVGNSAPMREIFAKIEKVAAGDANVYIRGESGTGKELIARAIHYSSPRRDRPLITLDCTAIPEGLIESHLFGHVKGAFTGAIDNRDGVFSLAHTGTLFIDELGELSLPLQAKLLRVIQTREFVKVGGSKPIHTNIRLIAAANRDLKKAVEEGTFREDLYYRVAVVTISVPPLRERRQDIPLLVEHFVHKFSHLYSKPLQSVTPWVVDALAALSWPGNVRQLENFVEQAVVLAEGDSLNEHDLLLDEGWSPVAARPLEFELGLTLRELERRYILRTIEKVRGNRTEAARLLGISLRCLQYRLKAYLRDSVARVQGDGSDPVLARDRRGVISGRLQPRLPFPSP